MIIDKISNNLKLGRYIKTRKILVSQLYFLQVYIKNIHYYEK